MITHIMEVLQDIFEDELATKSTYYDDDLIDSIVLREVDGKDPTPTIGFLVGNATPGEYEIGNHNASQFVWPLEIQLLVKHSSQEEGLELIRKLARRIFLCLYRDATSTAIMTTDTMGTLSESCVKYNVVGRNYGSVISPKGGMLFGATIDLEFTIEITIN